MNTLLSQFIAHATSTPITSNDSATMDKLVKLSLLDGLPRVHLEQLTNNVKSTQNALLKGLGNNVLQLKLPPALTLPTAKQWQYAKVKGQPDSIGLLLAQTLSKSTNAITEANVRLLIQQITSAASSTLSLDTSVQGKLVNQSSQNIKVKLTSGLELPLPVASKPLPLGRGIKLSLISNPDKLPKLNVSMLPEQTHSKASKIDVIARELPVAKQTLQMLVKEGMAKSGITLFTDTVQKATPVAGKLLANVFPANTLRAAATVKANQGQLTVQAALSTPQFRLPTVPNITIPTEVGQISIPRITLSSLPLAQVEKAPEKSVGSSAVLQQSVNKSPIPKIPGIEKPVTNLPSAPNERPLQDEPTRLQQSDVHRVIVEMSRSLLTKTGSTNTALTQLKAILQSVSNAPQPQAEAVETVTKLTQRLNASINEVTPKLNEPKAQVSSGMTQPTLPKAAQPKGEVSSKASSSSPSHVNEAIKLNVKVPAAETATPSRETSILVTPPSNTNTISRPTKSSMGTTAVISPSFFPLLVKAKDSTSTLGNIQQLTPETTTSVARPPLAESIAQLVQSATLPVTPRQLLSPATGGTFMQGIISMLQISLASKALQRAPSLKQQIDTPGNVIAKSLGVTGAKTPPSKVLQDFASADSKGVLLDSLKTILANHQHNKLTSAEARINGQDNFYYIIPSLSENTQPPEIRIYREPENREHKDAQKGKRKLWNIIMKLDIGEFGQLLAKSKINDNDITLDFYTSNEILMTKVADTLPYLKRRLTEMGIIVDGTSVQQGVIPVSLERRPHHIFETRV